jgi:hypothetical protein
MGWRSISFALLVLALGHLPLSGAELHDEIDRLIAAKAGTTVLAAPCDDATFLRRAYFDFAGRIPRLEESRAFLADTSPDKRTRLIDALLASPDYARHMEEAFHVMLMERRGDHAEWSKFLRKSFEANKPWDQLAREIIYPIADDETKRGAAYFHTRRLEKNGQEVTDYPGLTRDVGRLFMGIDLQCAQCHDHLFINDYKQVDFQGLYTVFANTSIKGDVQFPAVAEKPASAKLEFVSVFDTTRQATGPRIPFGTEFPLPATSGSALKLLADSLPVAENRLFVQNAANRLWFLMLGRGLVHPLDLQHEKNPPSHPELLQLLGQEFAAHKFDVKWFLRELALSQTYARSSELSAAEPPLPELFAVGLERRLSAEQLVRSMLIATGDPTETHDADKLSKSFDALRPKALKAFANPAKEAEDTYNATVQGALTLLNDEAFLKLFEAKPGNLTERLAKQTDAAQLADELYLAILVRPPSEDEKAEIAAILSKPATMGSEAQRTNAVKQLVWALVASTEFSLNH